MTLKAALFITAGVGALALLPSATFARTQLVTPYLSRVITIVAPYPPAGPPDVITHIVASSMGTKLGRSIVLENKPGTATKIGTASASCTPLDRYTPLTVEPSFMVVSGTHVEPGDIPLKGFRAVSLPGRAFPTLGEANKRAGVERQRIRRLAGSHVSGIFTGPRTTAPLTASGKLKILRITGRSRILALPHVPTFLGSESSDLG